LRPTSISTASPDVIVGREDLAGGADFRQHIDDAVGPGERRIHDIGVELCRNIDAAVGDPVVERRRGVQALQPALLEIAQRLLVNTGCSETAES